MSAEAAREALLSVIDTHAQVLDPSRQEAYYLRLCRIVSSSMSFTLHTFPIPDHPVDLAALPKERRVSAVNVSPHTLALAAAMVGDNVVMCGWGGAAEQCRLFIDQPWSYEIRAVDAQEFAQHYLNLPTARGFVAIGDTGYAVVELY